MGGRDPHFPSTRGRALTRRSFCERLFATTRHIHNYRHRPVGWEKVVAAVGGGGRGKGVGSQAWIVQDASCETGGETGLEETKRRLTQ